MKKYNLFGTQKVTILCRTKDLGKGNKTVMIPITEEDENNIDKNKTYTIQNDTNKYLIENKDILIYGEVSLNDDDIKVLDKLNIIPDEGGIIYSNIDLKTGIVEVEGNYPKQYSTFDPVIWFEYNYMLLGNPQRILIFKCPKNIVI